jgi:archaellum component FlaD/FlaE
MECLARLNRHYLETEEMIDPTPHEMNAVLAGGANAGEYLESIGKTDLAAMTADEWTTFLLAVVSGYIEHLKNEVPF